MTTPTNDEAAPGATGRLQDTKQKASAIILQFPRFHRKVCCKVPAWFPCECRAFFEMRQRVRAVRRYLAGGGLC